ncbi:hypothetical protein IPH25_03980 [bacterium]|nr:MAG: hypothetical protein IPG37_00975 [bacterium]QQR61608.1 MAG: hypothetical protein IPH25_03980 [bacterium]QQR62831.1 MAG: hypothetical protein IPH67_05510 [bacterium]
MLKVKLTIMTMICMAINVSVQAQYQHRITETEDDGEVAVHIEDLSDGIKSFEYYVPKNIDLDVHNVDALLKDPESLNRQLSILEMQVERQAFKNRTSWLPDKSLGSWLPDMQLQTKHICALVQIRECEQKLNEIARLENPEERYQQIYKLAVEQRPQLFNMNLMQLILYASVKRGAEVMFWDWAQSVKNQPYRIDVDIDDYLSDVNIDE